MSEPSSPPDDRGDDHRDDHRPADEGPGAGGVPGGDPGGRDGRAPHEQAPHEQAPHEQAQDGTGGSRPRPGRDAGTGTGTGTGGHPSEEDVDALLDADLLEVRDRGRREREGPPPEAVTAAHVLDCRRCQAVLADMRGVRGLLRRQGAGTPPPPEDLAARIAAAVAEDAERGRRAARARRGRRALALAASVAVLGGLSTALGVQVHEAQTGGSAGSAADAAASGSAPAPDGDPVVVASGTDYALGEVGGQVTALLSGPGDPAEDPADDLAGASRPGADAPPAPQAQAPEGGGAGGGGGGGDEGAGSSATPTSPSGLAEPGPLQECLTALGRPDADVVAVDTARWEGRPADVLVLPDDAAPGPGGQLAVWVVRVGCPGGQEALLHYEVVRR